MTRDEERATRPRTRSPIPTATGLIVGVTAASLGVFRPPGPLADLLLAGLLGLLACGYLLAWRAGLDELVLTRRLPRVATKGEALRVVHELLNTGPRLIRNVAVTERPAAPRRDALPAGTAGTFFPELLPRLRVEARTRLFLGRRGKLHLDAVTLTAGDPFGLFSVERICSLPGDILVQPRPRRTERLSAIAQEIRQAALEGASGEWSRVREWRAGDPLRSVHWRLTARRGFPIVRTRDLPKAEGLTLILDRTCRPDRRGVAIFENAVALIAGLGLTLLEQGNELDVLAPGADAPLTLTRLRGRAGSRRLLDALALVAPDPDGLSTLAASAIPQAATVVAAREPDLSPEQSRRISLQIIAGRSPSQPPRLLHGARA